MIISTTEELRRFLPAHQYNNLDPVLGFLDNSEADFLADRIGKPLLAELNNRYPDIKDELVYDAPLSTWAQLLVLCQRCVVYDAFMRMADIQAVSLNDAGINISESSNYDAATDKTIAAYKQQMNKEAHAAANRLLVQLEDWQKTLSTSTDSTTSISQRHDMPDNGEDAATPSDIEQIIDLWRKSSYYYFADGLLINTATEFNLYVNIYDSREKFIQLLPDIRYCQETQLEAELGFDLLQSLIDRHRHGILNAIEQRAYTRLQRTLSLMVEARSPLFKRAEAKDESIGQLHIVLDFIRSHSYDFDEDAMRKSPLAPKCQCASPSKPNPRYGHAVHDDDCDNHGMLISSMI